MTKTFTLFVFASLAFGQYTHKVNQVDTSCSISVERVGGESDIFGSASFGLDCGVLESVMKKAGKRSVTELSGYKFQSAIKDPTLAIRDHAVRCRYELRHGHDYSPPTSSQMDVLIAKALAQARDPDFSEVDFATRQQYIRQAMSDPYSVKSTWLGRMAALGVDLAEWPNHPNTGGRGNNAHLRLSKGGRDFLVVVGPWDPPIWIYKGR